MITVFMTDNSTSHGTFDGSHRQPIRTKPLILTVYQVNLDHSTATVKLVTVDTRHYDML